MNAKALRVLAALALVPIVLAATPSASESPDMSRSASMRWKINTHLYAANIALADALNDSMVTIAPYGEFPVAPAALAALREAPAAYRAGVLAPDLFPDMFVGGWIIHSDLTESEHWTADNWMRHVWSKARAWPNTPDRNKVMAFAYGFLTHGAGDMFAHSWVNEKANGAWVSFWGKDKETAFKHIVLEGYVGEHTPPTDISLDVWPRFVNNILIKDPAARQHSSLAKHYRHWLAIYDALPPLIARAENDMNATVGKDAPYWLRCTTNPNPCLRKEQMETWRLDINRGLRAIVDSSESLGEMIMDGEPADGVGAMTGWATEWLPKMYGAHAIGEGTAAMAQFMDWAGNIVPIDSFIKAQVESFMKQEMPKIWNLYEAAQKPSYWMEKPGFFPPGTKETVSAEMGVAPGGERLNWRAFEPLYNTVILSKLVLLDGTGLNELARRAGMSAPPFRAGDDVNIMLGVFKSMTQSYQWRGEEMTATTQFGICGPETGEPLKLTAVCGVPYRPLARELGGATNLSSRENGAGFTLWGHPEAREKIFSRIFKGYGAGPGTSDLKAVAELSATVVGVREGRRALRSAAGQTEYMREVVANMRGKVGGAATSAPVGAAARQPGALRPGADAITNWGQRCCAKDIAELRAALTLLQSSSGALQNPAMLARLGRRPSAAQIAPRAAYINSALAAFATTRDAATATAALATIANQIELLAAIVAGYQ